MSKSAANRILRAGAVAISLGTLFAAFGSSAQADTVYRGLVYDWFANAAPPGTAPQPVKHVIPGAGGWICSPAGFGQHSHCYQG